uniref:Carboxylic ester hydrolase n=1 Tax=Sitophilus oryzae TaxID=7048 RepID=A0A2S0BZ03_SITOR|nr:esterase 6 [Sitophilus oryzae]
MFSVWILVLLATTTTSANLVFTKSGPIIGRERWTDPENKLYYAYQGIPYAKPPVGDLRFADPVPPEHWILPKLTISDQSRCLQLSLKSFSSEDCLYMNVYSPTNNASAKLPVMVWIYGGFFLFGDGDYKDLGPDYFLEQDVVFVDFNYRLGVLGFLSTADEAASGNWALKDQILALKWVQDNIENFGGDKNSVTLFGQSAGAGASSYLSLMPETKGLFHKVILQSGSALNLWSLARQPRRAAFAVGNFYGIDTNDSKTLVEELRKVDALNLTVVGLSEDLRETIEENPRDGLIFGPVIEPSHDGAVVTWKSYEKMASGDFNQVPYMMGFTSQEGGQTVEVIDWIKLYILATFDADPVKLVPICMNINDTTSKNAVSLFIKTHYFGIIPAAFSDEEIIQYISDDQFVRPVYQSAKLMSQYTDVYLYRFSYLGDVYKSTRSTTDVYHAEELNYLFKIADNPQLTSTDDLKVRKQLIKLWTNFAKYSNPTPQLDFDFNLAIWDKVDSNNIRYLDIGNYLAMSSNLTQYSLDFWQELYDSHGVPPYDTY